MDTAATGIPPNVGGPRPQPVTTAFDLIGLTDLRKDAQFQQIDGSGFAVVVIDTGIDATHPNLTNNFLAFADFRTSSSPRVITNPKNTVDTDPDGPTMNPEIAIATFDLTKQFDRHLAVNDVELQINSGEVYGLIGPNGAGKTTLIKMLAALEEPSRGEIYIYGDRLDLNQDNRRLKQKIGYLPDDFPLYEDLTVLDYLEYFARLYNLKQPHRRHRIQDVLELVQLTSKRQSLIATLSRGMKQRLSLARTIIYEPLVLFLDEPVSGLDPMARVKFREIIQVLQAAQMTVLISSHVLSDLAQLCTSIGIMELGCLVESTSLGELYQRLSRQHILISTLGSLDSLVAELKNYPQVEEWQVIPPQNRIKVSFSGNAQASAELLKVLIMAGLPISEFQQTQEDLESIFLKLGHQQAS